MRIRCVLIMGKQQHYERFVPEVLYRVAHLLTVIKAIRRNISANKQIQIPASISIQLFLSLKKTLKTKQKSIHFDSE